MKQQNKSFKTKPLIQFLPKDADAVRILKERAERIARKAIAAAQTKAEEAYVRFRLGPQEYYGLPYRYTKEVLHKVQTTPLPQAPEFIAGVLNNRGALLAILDLKRLFQINPPEYENAYVLIVTSNNLTFGCLADNIEGSYAYDPKSLDAPLPSEGGIKQEYILGLDQARTALLKVDVILADIQTQLRGIYGKT